LAWLFWSQWCLWANRDLLCLDSCCLTPSDNHPNVSGCFAGRWVFRRRRWIMGP
jgi:hypothetical protein